MRQGSTVAGLVLATVVAFGAALTPSLTIVVRTAANEVLACRPIDRDSRVTLVFTHSMYGGDVRESFVADSGTMLRRTNIMTDNAAAAEYYATDGRIVPLDHGYELLLPEQTFDELVFRIDEIGRHRLIVDDEVIDLTMGSGGSRQARLDVVAGTVGGSLLGRLGRSSPC